jgi:hypothetical protein
MMLLLSVVASDRAAAQKKTVAPIRIDALVMPLAVTTISNQAVAPATISFTATDPDLGNFPGSSGATVSWKTTNGAAVRTWALTVAAGAANFTSCATVPASAIKATCSSVTGGTSGLCASAIQLSTTGTQIASGNESASTNAPYSVSLTFTLADSWRHIAEQAPACTLNLSYTITAN